MTLDPQAQMVLDFLRDNGVLNVSVAGVERARRQQDARRFPPGPAAQVSDRSIDGPGGPLPLRIYRPEQAEHRGALVYFHGGGFVLGSLDGHDALCRQICVDARCLVVSVDYRLAPEHKFPAAVEDACAAVRWVHAHASELGFDPGKLAVGGDSAGANLATVAAALARKDGPPLVLQLLFYPTTDLRSFDRPSTLANATGKLISRDDMMWFTAQYTRDERDRHDPRASPLAAGDLRGMPPALVITAEHDPLCDEGKEYADALRAAGNRVTYSCYPGMIHGFVSMYAFVDQGRAALREGTEALAAALGK